MGKNAELKEKQKWSHEQLHLDNARKLRGIYFIDPEDKEFTEGTSRMLARNWKHQCSHYPAKLFRTIRIAGVVHPMESNQNLRAFWKLMNLQECVWETRYRKITKTILQEKVRIHYNITIWFTNLFLCLKQ